MHSTLSIQVSSLLHAEAAHIFRVLTDVTHWPEWTPSVQQIEVIKQASLGTGVQVRMHQPKLAPGIWTFSKWQPDQQFSWEKPSAGLTMTAEHRLTPTAQGCEVTLRMTYSGWLSGLLYRLTRKLTTEYMQMEINGLKAICEKQ